MTHPVAEYLQELYLISGVSVPETSGYPALSRLLNAVGSSLKPKITAVIHPSNNGAGIPDGGLFSAKELKKHGQGSPALLQLKPERGVIEVKALDTDLSAFESSPQVQKYLEHYGQILLTNYRAFALWSWRNGKAVAGERYSIAPTAKDFWDKTHTVRKDPKHPEHERLWQFLRRALLSSARIATPQDLALYLASYAREARARIEIAPMGALEPVKKAVSDALGVRFEGEKGLHFFQSTLIQTLFYGTFSAWVLWHEEHSRTTDRFQWRLSAQYLGLPILRTLFVQLAGDPKKVRALDLEEVLDWTEDCLARVDRASFFARYDMGDAVQYFYEPFLAEFDPELRKAFGVWYTPPEIVRYMVGSVDKALRENFHLADGLADPSVIVLDPCCGTGAYLVETLKLIRRRLVEGYGESQAGLKIKEVAKHRLYGFELLPAPYVVSHLQIDLMLTRWGAALDHEKDERAGVFLTNALTGWVPIKSPKDLPFSEFAAERDAADHVKQQEQILVIIGNPPYDGYAGMAVEEERNLSEAYRDTKEAPKPQGQGLNDLYIRFFRMAERRIAEGVPQSDELRPGPPRNDAKGIICYISNYSWLDGLSHTGMRERFMEVFDSITIDCLNGDKYKTGKKTPDGRPDPSVFSTEKNREGIQVGTAIALMERRPQGKKRAKDADAAAYNPHAELGLRHWWGANKRAELEATLEKPKDCKSLKPGLSFGLPFMPMGMNVAYNNWASLPSLLQKFIPGVQTKRDDFVVAFDKEELLKRLHDYFDHTIPDSRIAHLYPRAMEKTARFDPHEVRKFLLNRGLLPEHVVRYAYRPFDIRWVYWEHETKLLGEKSPDIFPQAFNGNIFIEARQRQVKDDFDRGYVVTALPDNFGNGFSSFFPLFLRPVTKDLTSDEAHPDLFAPAKPSGPQPNLTDFAREYLAGLKCGAEDLFFHIVAVLHAPLYREENAGALRQDWPRVPLPKTAKVLKAGADLGRQIASLLDPETPVEGVTTLRVREDLRGLGELTVESGGKTPDLAIAAGWGYVGQGGVTMPGSGTTTRGTRGEAYLDIHLNATTRWKDVPEPVWNYTLSGYRVLKKWLSYRESALLGRPLTSDEVQQFTNHVRRITVSVRCSPSPRPSGLDARRFQREIGISRGGRRPSCAA
ncbi:MAG: N-6 DNA methylase [Planctomycetes bacterium]|nr:N-6 DNA methylase [Planctomycetota bacterium]